MADKKTYRKEISLNGRMITGDDPAKVGENFQSLINMRYLKDRPVGVGGMSKVNTTALTTYTNVRSGIHYRKDQPSESHVLVEARDVSDNAKIYENTTAIANAGEFSATELFTPTAGADVGRWSMLPDGDLGYCNSEESYIWGGNEREVGGFINYDPNNDFSYDYTDQVRNTLDDTNNVAVLNAVDGGLDSDVMLLLHLDNNDDDASTSNHNVTNNNVTYTVTDALDGYRAVFTTDAYFTVPDSADFSYTSGNFTIDCHLELDDTSADYSIYYQNTTNDDDSFNIMVDSNGAVLVRLKAGGAKVFSGATDFKTDNSVISAGTVYHIEIVEDDDDWYIFVDGVLKGHTNDAARCVDYTGIVQIGYDGTTYLEGKVDEFRVSDVTRHTEKFDTPTTPYAADISACYIYLGAIRPLKGFKLYVKTANTEASTMAVSYWDGSAWAAVSSLSDGTDTGASLAQTGSVTFTSTVSTAKLKYINEVYLYWYKVHIDDISANTAIEYVTVDAPFQAFTDIWDGEPVQVDFAQTEKDNGFHDITLQIRENEYTQSDGATFADFFGLESDESLLFGFYERMSGIHFHLVSGNENKEDNTTVTVRYWNGTTWVSVGDVDDGTLKRSRSLGSSGVMSWNQISSNLEFTRNVNNDYELYYYKVTFDKTLDADDNDLLCFYVTGIRAQNEISAYKFPLLANDRTWLCANMKGKKNEALYSAADASHIFNGVDSGKLKFGDESELTGGVWLYSQYGSSIYNITLFFKESETWAVVGSNPEDWTKFRLSKTIGCPDPETIKVIDISSSKEANTNRSVAIWRADEGIYISDGRPPVLMSEDISDIFDKRDSNAISTTVASKGFWDNNEKEYHFLWAQGSATTLDKEYVLDFKKPGWFEIDRTSGNELQYGLEVQTTVGRNYTYGFIDTGYMLRLENGNDFNGTAITSTLQFGDIVPLEGQVSIETKIEHHGLIAVAKSTTTNTIAVTHYGDGSNTGTSWTHSSNKSGYRLLEPVEHKHTNSHIFHSWRMVMATDDETRGFEPLYFFMLFSVKPPGNHMKDRRI